MSFLIRQGVKRIVLAVWLAGCLPAFSLSFTDNFSTNPFTAGRFTILFGAADYQGAPNFRIRTSPVSGAPTAVAYNPGYYINVNGAGLSANVWRNNVAINSARWYLVDYAGRIATRSIPITNTQTNYSTTINAANFNMQAGFNLAWVRYVGVYYTNSTTNTTRRGFLDNFSLTAFKPSPEPATAVLGLMVSLLFCHWRRGKQGTRA